MGTKKKATRKIIFVVDDFPKKTTEIYVCGSCKELGEWDCLKAVKMVENGNGEYEATVLVDGIQTVEYKYLNHRDWKTVECGYVAEESDNRSFTSNNDKVIVDGIKGFKIKENI